MIREQQQRIIGKLVSVNTNRAVIELTATADNFVVSGFDDVHRFAQINSYVAIPYQNDLIIGEVLGVREKNRVESDKASHIVVSDNQIDINFIGELKLSYEGKYKFQFGITTYPPLYSDVLYIKDGELDVIFKTDTNDEPSAEDTSKTKAKTLKIGTSSVFPDYQVKVDIDSFFSKHIAVLGNTGSGKSCTISSILQSVFEKKSFSATGSTFVIFDANGEYLQALEKIENEDIKVLYLSPDNKQGTEVTNVSYESFHLPHWFLNFDEWALLLQASEKVQVPVLRTAINLAKKFANHSESAIAKELNHILAVSLIQILSSGEGAAGQANRMYTLLQRFNQQEMLNILNECNFSVKYGNFDSDSDRKKFDERIAQFIIDDFSISDENELIKFNIEALDHFLDLAMLYEESYGRSNVRSYCASLQTRLQSLLSRKRDYGFLMDEADTNFQSYIYTLMGLEKLDAATVKRKQIVIIDLSSYSDEVIEVISSVLSRMLLEVLQRVKPRNEYPVHIIIEEAHRYISEKDSDNLFQAKKIFERIAKEGRKYGVSLVISSQRPSELSKTVLSQCSNFIVHRIMNPEDLLYIKRMTPYISEEILNELPYIPRQQALVFGSAVNMPMMFKVREAKPKPKSDDNEINKHWYKDSGYAVNLDFGNLNVVDLPSTKEPARVITSESAKTQTEAPEPALDLRDIPF